MYTVFIHEDAAKDLDEFWKTDPDVAARLVVLLEECENNQDLLDRLTQHKFNDSDINISRWLALWNRDKNIWRLKLWDLERKGMQYRVIYAFIPTKKQYHFLAIAPRDFNYDPNHELTKRIIRAYKEL